MTAKQKLYKTAWSPLFECYVSIVHAHQDSDGRWIFTCNNKEHGLNNHLFRESELDNFVL